MDLRHRQTLWPWILAAWLVGLGLALLTEWAVYGDLALFN